MKYSFSIYRASTGDLVAFSDGFIYDSHNDAFKEAEKVRSVSQWNFSCYIITQGPENDQYARSGITVSPLI